jgi:hypothetical protein
MYVYTLYAQGQIQDFKLGGAHLRKLRRAEGSANIFGVFRVKIHDFEYTHTCRYIYQQDLSLETRRNNLDFINLLSLLHHGIYM